MKVLFKTVTGETRWYEIGNLKYGNTIRFPYTTRRDSNNGLGKSDVYSFREYELDGSGHDSDGDFLIYREKQ